MPSSIGWLWPPGFKGESWNPVTGCEKISPGCAHCYAETFARRFPKSASYSPNYLPGTARIVSHEDRLSLPLRWKYPRFIFVNSQSDLFHEDVPEAFIDALWIVMGLTPRHTFLILTKRPERMLEWAKGPIGVERMVKALKFVAKVCPGVKLPTLPSSTIQSGQWLATNVWLGVSVENQVFADKRIPLLIDTPAAVHFISHEPALKRVDLGNWMEARSLIDPNQAPDPVEAKRTLSLAGLSLLDWVIVGGESGAKARDCVGGIEEAMRSTLADCRAAGVAYFGKQMGSPWAKANGDKGKGENMNLWPEDLRVREWPKIVAPVL